MEREPFVFEIDEYIIKIDNMFPVRVSVYSKINPEVVFEICTKFLATRFDKSSHSSVYLHLEKFSREYQLHQFEVKKKDGQILIYNTETKIRFCRIPIAFIEEVIAKCNKLVKICPPEEAAEYCIKNEDTKIISINDNSDIVFRFEKFTAYSRPCYLFFSEDKYLVDWMTLLEYESIPEYKISVKKYITGQLHPIEVQD